MQKIKWEVSPIYSNVIIVNIWRDKKMIEDKKAEDEKTMKKLLPVWRQFLLNTHTAITTVASFVWTPVTWVTEQLNGTADFRVKLAAMEAQEKKDKLAQQASQDAA